MWRGLFLWAIFGSRILATAQASFAGCTVAGRSASVVVTFTQQGRIVERMTTAIVATLPNGDLRIAGQFRRGAAPDVRRYSLSATVRAVDLRPDRTVDVDVLRDLRIDLSRPRGP